MLVLEPRLADALLCLSCFPILAIREKTRISILEMLPCCLQRDRINVLQELKINLVFFLGLVHGLDAIELVLVICFSMLGEHLIPQEAAAPECPIQLCSLFLVRVQANLDCEEIGHERAYRA